MMPSALPQGVSRETLERLARLETLLSKWNPAINLVSRSTIANAWERHILDSAQLFALAPDHATHWVDLGSGGGFPGLVIACLSADLRPGLRVTLIESDQRKCTFLRQAAAELGIKPGVLSTRIETAPPQAADILSARALSALPNLLSFARRHLAPHGIALFPKGATWQEEVEHARKEWHFDLTTHPSLTDPQAVILAVKDLTHV
ncbi:16S rRNA (guanine(527)-N(7))-methyltransferase RsmG [Tabrizicola sp. M-4]|uniref:16S rRNA (guanine(527)-N(7))-methyltransferase RsmG n=1 Tax=Tabrizicola sp. M-4 TaxID=3055847 RepID=UPI003DA8C2BD